MTGGVVVIYFLVFLAGVMLSLMQSFGGVLSGYIGLFGSSFVVHLIGGVLLIAYLAVILRQRIRLGPMPWYAYLAAVFGIALTTTNSYCVTRLGASLTTCLSVAGQLFFSILIDHFGLLGMRKRRFDPRRLPALGLILAGLALVTFAG